MRIIHISDLHLGLQYGDYSLIEDQSFILQQIIDKVSALKADVLLISGDIYHKYAPNPESFQLWSKFLEKLEPLKIHTFITSGNHDSADRLGVAANYLKYGNIFLETKYEGKLQSYHFDKDGIKVQFTLLPFIRPSNVRNQHDDFSSNRYNDAIEYVLKDFSNGDADYNILLAHQFVIHGDEKPALSDSEIQPQVGGIDAIHTSLFEPFDYVALGHIHKPQKMGRETLRYSGSPLKYSKTESNDKKGMVVIDLGEELKIHLEPLKPLRDVRVITGDLETIIAEAPKPLSQDFIHVNLTDAIRPINAMDRLKEVYPYCVDIEFKVKDVSKSHQSRRASTIIELKPSELMNQFYTEVLEKEMTEKTSELVDSVIAQVQEEQK